MIVSGVVIVTLVVLGGVTVARRAGWGWASAADRITTGPADPAAAGATGPGAGSADALPGGTGPSGTPTPSAAVTGPASGAGSAGQSTTGTSGAGGTALRPTGAPSGTSAGASGGNGDLSASFTRLTAGLHVRSAGLAFVPLGGGPVTRLGTWSAGPGWSTMKVPLSVAALRASPTSSTRSLVHRAITESDNAAAESLWSLLGSGRKAAAAVDVVLRAHGDTATRTQADRVRPPYTPFGQTTWTLADQARFLSALACSADARPVLDEMSQVIASQRWGLGRLPAAAFKGGWGPDPSGRYLVRQVGVVTVGGHRLVVALAALPADGSFDGGVRALDAMANWLARSVHPTTGGCR